MAWTQTQIDALKAAIASGTRTVAYADKTITYQSTESMIAALAAMEAEVASAAGTSNGRSTLASTSRA